MEVNAEPQSSYYERQGYYIFPRLIDDELVDNLLDRFQSSIKSSNKYFFRQSTNRWEKSRYSKSGHVIQSFLNVHNYDAANFAGFSEAARNIFCGDAVKEALRQLTGAESHDLVQTMFFDQNAATPAHQDYYYLDSIPAGHLLAGWFALEDIDVRAGRFFVLPGSNRDLFELTEDQLISNRLYANCVDKYLKEHIENLIAPSLNKGDVLFWNSRTIHGSLRTIDPKFSRKSLTAHYVPHPFMFSRGIRYANQAVKKAWQIHLGMRYASEPAKFTLREHLLGPLRNALTNYAPALTRGIRRILS